VPIERWANLQRIPRVSVLVDDGDDYGELRAVELLGAVDMVGDVPRRQIHSRSCVSPSGSSAPSTAVGRFGPTAGTPGSGSPPEKIVSWDFRKLADL